MEYHIAIGSEGQTKIASFENEQDRDLCLSALQEYHSDLPDDYFKTQNDNLIERI